MGKTNAEEREALAKIREILEDFSPEDTYIGKAFEGCVEQAEENIRNDWMTSYKDHYESRDREVLKINEKLVAATEKLRESEEHRVELANQLNQKDDAIARLEDAKNQLSKEIAKRDDNRQELLGRIADAKAEISDLRQTIIELKAKLYDMMTREEVKG